MLRVSVDILILPLRHNIHVVTPGYWYDYQQVVYKVIHSARYVMIKMHNAFSRRYLSSHIT